MPNPTIRAAESYVLDGIKNQDLGKIPLDPSVIFQGPFQTAPLHGIEALREFLDGIYPVIKDVHLKKRVASVDEVCLLWELEMGEGKLIPILEYFRVSEGRVVEIRPFYDPRPLVSAG